MEFWVKDTLLSYLRRLLSDLTAFVVQLRFKPTKQEEVQKSSYLLGLSGNLFPCFLRMSGVTTGQKSFRPGEENTMTRSRLDVL